MTASQPELTGKAPPPGRYAKVSLFLRKRSDISDEYFHAYWANNHVTPAFQNKTFIDKVRRYNQVRRTPNPFSLSCCCTRNYTLTHKVASRHG